MDQETVGSLLKGQRLKAGLSLEKISRQTYIRPYYLDALERGDFRTVGDPVYVKGFLRNYAGVLGLDAEEILLRYRRESEGEGAQAENPQVVSETPEGYVPTGERRIPRRGGRRPWNAAEWAIIAAGAGIVALFWIWVLYM